MTNNQTVIKVENLSKQYRLGLVGTGTLSHDLNRWWAQLRGKEDPYLKVGAVNKREESTGRVANEYVWALKDINFEVKQGEVLGIIGKNGAGKSTLLKILSRVTGPTTGSFKAKGRIASLLEVGTGFHPELTGKENIFLNGAILGMTKTEIRSKIDEIINFSGVEKYIDTPVKRYSSGMYVRLAFAVAAHLDPEILIIDEVLAVGDAEFQKKCLGKMKEVAGEGRTVLFVSHNMGAVMKLCKNAVLLDCGRFALKGTADEVVKYYLNRSDMNELPAFIDLREKFSAKELILLNVQLSNQKRNTSHFHLSDSIRILLEYEVITPLKGGRFNFQLLDAHGVVVFTATTHGFEQSYLQQGKHCLLASIPPYLLTKGTYSINFSAGIPGVKNVYPASYLLAFYVEVTGETRSFYPENSEGVIFPKMEWEFL